MQPVRTTLDLAMPIVGKTPRDYQARGVFDVEDCMLNRGLTRLLYKSPTGSGKTLASKMISLSNPIRNHLGVAPGEKLRILFIANKHRLNRQALDEYDDITSENGAVELMVHSAFSEIPQRIIDRGWHMCFIDEAHHEAMMSIQLLLNQLVDRPIIGFTADDERGDGKLLKFERVICPITEREAALAGYIEKVGVNTILDTSFKDKSVLASQLVDRYRNHMGNTIAFFKTNEEARAFHLHLRNQGLTSFFLATNATENDMDNALAALAQGETQFVVNCHKIGEGVDVKQCTDVILARHFYTKSEKRQFIGRAIRNDSPCAVWEFQNPLRDTISAKDVAGATKYERLLYLQKGKWHEKLFRGEDPTWGHMAKLRCNPENPNPDWESIKREYAERAAMEAAQAAPVESAARTRRVAPFPATTRRAAPYPASTVRRAANGYEPSI